MNLFFVYRQELSSGTDRLTRPVRLQKNWAQIIRRKQERRFIFLIVFLFAVFVLIVGGTWLVYTRFHLGVTSASLEINLGYVYLALPLGGLLTAYYAIDNTIALFRSSNS